MKFIQKKTESLIRRPTFVGSAEYVSPEMLSEKEVGPEGDLWAFGCILFQMYSGTSPFKDKTEYLIFRNILEGKLSIPKEFPVEAADLIKSLLIIDPEKRIGAGPQENDFDKLKAHKYFSGINFDTISISLIPEKELLKSKKKPEKDVSKSLNNSIDSKSLPLKVLKEGIVKKKSPWFHYNTRKLILYSTSKIEYLDSRKNIVKGVIYLNKDCKAVLEDNNSFELITPKRTFVFKVRKMI